MLRPWRQSSRPHSSGEGWPALHSRAGPLKSNGMPMLPGLCSGRHRAKAALQIVTRFPILCGCRLQFCDAIGSAERLADLEDAEPQSAGLGFAGLGFAGGSSIGPSSDGSMPGEPCFHCHGKICTGPSTRHCAPWAQMLCRAATRCKWLNKGRQLPCPWPPCNSACHLHVAGIQRGSPQREQQRPPEKPPAMFMTKQQLKRAKKKEEKDARRSVRGAQVCAA